MGQITSNDKDDSKTMNIRIKVVINSNQTWSEVTSITNVMMERTMTQNPYENVTHLTLKEI